MPYGIMWYALQLGNHLDILIDVAYNRCKQQINALQGRNNQHDGVSNHRYLGCLLSPFSRRGSNKTSKLRVTGLCEGNSPVTSEFPAQKASNAENVSIWWRHHVQRSF